jgi:hypothetical protein
MTNSVETNDDRAGTARVGVRNGNAIKHDSAGLLSANGGAIVRHVLPRINVAQALKPGQRARGLVNVFEAIDAGGTSAKLRDEKRGSEHGDVFCKHGLLHMGHGGIVQFPERVHHQCDRDKESNQQPCAPSSVVAHSNAEPANDGHDSG